FIAVADDATAASWNPAGLTQLMQPEVSFAFSHFSRRDDFSSRSYPEVSGMQKTLVKDLNYFSIAFPFEFLERNMIVSLNYQRLYEFDRDIRTDLTERSTDPPLQYDQKVDFRQKGKLSALSPAFAVEVTPDFALGVTCNIWTDNLFWSNGWESDLVIKGATFRDGRLSSTVKSTDRDRYYGFSGFNMHIGFLWHINSFLTVGGVVKTPFTADMEHEREVVTVSRMIGGLPATGSMRIDEDVELEMPLSYGLGVAMRFTDRLTVSCDIYRTAWSHFRLEDGSGNRLNPLTGKPSHESPTRATHQVRLGAEYLFILPKTIIPLRCGLFYDPEPSEKSPEDFWGFLHHLVLPAVVLGFELVAVMTRMTRSTMLDELNKDYVQTHRAQGLPESQIITRYILKNALLP
ncbi:MAG: outer membrane protein transport protein, partial [Rhodospirillales bacterium]|nr:outer membrane protein transport protein [Rhodospirillales bacterium]